MACHRLIVVFVQTIKLVTQENTLEVRRRAPRVVSVRCLVTGFAERDEIVLLRESAGAARKYVVPGEPCGGGTTSAATTCVPITFKNPVANRT